MKRFFSAIRVLRQTLNILLGFVVFPAGGAIVFSEDFESGLSPGWQVGDSNPSGSIAYWGVVDFTFGGEGAHGGTNKIYCAGVGRHGTTANPFYTNSMSVFLTRSVDLTSCTNATLRFWYKIPSIESVYDFANVYINNTKIWVRDTAATVWTEASLNLNAYVGATHTLRFEFDSDATVVGEGWYVDDILVTDESLPPLPPPNDNFNSALVLSNSTGGLGNRSNAGATDEPGEPAPGNSVWFRWTAGTNGTVTFETTGSSFDTVLCVYTGSVLSNLVEIACNDNATTNATSIVSFAAVQGTTYHISIRGVEGDTGEVQLNWNQPNGRGDDLLPDLFVWADQSRSYLYGWYLDYDEIPGRILLRLSTATPNMGAGALELRGSSTTAGVYQRVFLSGGGFYDRYAGTFTFHEGHQHLHFDNWMNFHLRAVLTNNNVGDIVISGDKTSFAIIDLTRYDPYLPGSPPLGQYTGGLTQGLSIGWSDVYSADLQDQWIDVTDVPSGSYWLEAVVDPANSILESNETNNASRILINLSLPAPATNRPPNDSFTNAIVINGITAGLFSSNVSGTKESGEPDHYDDEGVASVWFRWTAPSNMPITITTEGSDFDTIMAVYRGTNVSALTLITNNDDLISGNTNSRVTFAAATGITYHIAIDGYGSATGSIQLNFNPAWNDEFANAVLLSGNAGSTSASNRGATGQTAEPAHAGTGGNRSVWFKWTAPMTGPVVINTTGSGFDTLLAVYTGTELTNLAEVASNDNHGTNHTSQIAFEAINGVTYYIAVDGANNATGLIQLNWQGPLPPGIVQPPFSTNAPAGATVHFSINATGTALLKYKWFFENFPLQDGDYVSGTATPTVTLSKIRLTNMGAYFVVISNDYGAITSSPANLIVLENYRVAFVHAHEGHIGGVVSVPIEMQAVGDENAMAFSFSYDTAVLSNPRILNSPVNASISTDTNQTGLGRFGVTLNLATNETIGFGTRPWIIVLFDAASGLTNETMTSIGFSDQPVAKRISDVNGAELVTLFNPGFLLLHHIDAFQTGTFRPDGRYEIATTGIAGRQYIIEASEDLAFWTPISTNQADLNGTLHFIEEQSTNVVRRFYRALLQP